MIDHLVWSPCKAKNCHMNDDGRPLIFPVFLIGSYKTPVTKKKMLHFLQIGHLKDKNDKLIVISRI